MVVDSSVMCEWSQPPVEAVAVMALAVMALAVTVTAVGLEIGGASTKRRRWAGGLPSSMCKAGRLLLDLGMVLQRGTG